MKEERRKIDADRGRLDISYPHSKTAPCLVEEAFTGPYIFIHIFSGRILFVHAFLQPPIGDLLG